MMNQLANIFLTVTTSRRTWQRFLIAAGIHDFSESELSVIDETIAIFDGEQNMLATGSLAGNVMKYVATNQTDAAYFNQLVSELENRLSQRGISPYFVFTKPEYAKKFRYIGFQTLSQTDDGVLLEKGYPTISQFLKQCPKGDPAKQNGAIVMNANPFTLGHQQLVEKAASESDHVYLFVVSEDCSLFSSEERFTLVRQGVAHLPNVTVLPTAAYMVSYTTFPAYFLSGDTELVSYQAQLDARVFKNWFVPYFSISSRYVGEEPFSPVTHRYNQLLVEELQPEVAVKVIPRHKNENKVISATLVRQYLSDNRLKEMKQLVPETTYAYIITNQLAIKNRMKDKKWK